MKNLNRNNFFIYLKKGTKGKPRKTVRSIIRNLPGTKFTSASKYSSFGKRIADIFNGNN